MALTKKDFIALADELRPLFLGLNGFDEEELAPSVIDALCRFLATQNPKFNEQKWREYLAEKE